MKRGVSGTLQGGMVSTVRTETSTCTGSPGSTRPSALPGKVRSVGRPAAFFDLDRTFLARSSALALAGSFRARGLIGRRQLARALARQLLFSARGADEEGVRRVTERGMRVLRGLSPEEVRGLVEEALETALRSLVYREALELARRHREAGEPIYLASAVVREIVEPLAVALELDGALGSVAEVERGQYTGRLLLACHGEGKAEAVRALAAAEGIDLRRSAAYSDSVSDLPLLEAVGRPFAVNPDRGLRREARRRGWPVLAFSALARPAHPGRVRPALLGVPVVLGAGAVYLAGRQRG